MSAHNDEFKDKVFPAELEEIKRRRETLGIDTKGLDPEELDGEPAAKRDLAGLALSGGGIRSATFSLGVIQALANERPFREEGEPEAAHGILEHVDYLSTVSGGGYIGSCVSSLLNEPLDESGNRPLGPGFPLKYTAGVEEPPALTHLRNSSNYLIAGGMLGKLRLPNLLLRGILMNLFAFLPFVMAGVFVTEAIFENGPHWDGLPKLVLPLVALFVASAIAFPFARRFLGNRFDWRTRNAYELWLTIPLLLVAILLAAIPIMRLTQLAMEHRMDQVVEFLAGLGTTAWWRASVVLIAVAGLFMLAGKASENVSKLRGRLLLWLIGLLGPLMLFAIYLGLCLWQIESPFIPLSAANVLDKVVVECGPVDPRRDDNFSGPYFDDLHDDDDDPEPEDERSCFMKKAIGKPGPKPRDFGDLWDALIRPKAIDSTAALIDELKGRNIEFYNDAIVSCQSAGPPPQPCGEEPTGDWRDDERVWVVQDHRHNDARLLGVCPKWGTAPPADGPASAEWIAKNCTYFMRGSDHALRIEGAELRLLEGRQDWVFFAVFGLLLVFNRYFLDINIASPHGFYRDRLSKAFLFGLSEDGGDSDGDGATANKTQQNDRLKLTELNGLKSTAPYQLINVALNLQGSTDPDLRGRGCDFFIFSKRYTGSDRTGYAKTEDMETYDRHLDLGTATAISGAAAAPNMGTTTNRSLVFIMTMLNIRLGYWLPNPRNVNREYWYKKLSLGGAKPTLILKEAVGLLDAKGSYVNVSDGGHIENLAIYQLLRRRCKFIVAVDGEADPDMSFHGLVTLMRYARIDMGIEIDINLDDLRKDADGLSKSQWTLGRIRYGDGGDGEDDIGHLLYVKLSVKGDEPEYIRAYRARWPDYPHQSTADQFFSEDQFEAYRALGEHICKAMLRDVRNVGRFRDLNAKSFDDLAELRRGG